MRAEIVNTSDKGRVIVSRVPPIGEKSVCLEIHRRAPPRSSEDEKFMVSFIVLTLAEATELADALAKIVTK